MPLEDGGGDLSGAAARSRWPEALIGLATLAVLVAPLGVATWRSWAEMFGPSADWFRWQAGLGLVLVSAAMAAWHRLRPPSPRTFLLVAVAVSAVARLVYVLRIDVKPISDFEEMWALANQLATEGLGPKGFFFFRERTLGFFLPLAALFGPGGPVYEVANVIATVATSLLAYLLARRWFGEAAGRVALLITMLVPETYFTSAIPTHDIPGAMYLMGALAALDQLWVALEARHWRRAAGLSLLTGLLVELTDLQRGFRPFWLVAVLGVVALVALRALATTPSHERSAAVRSLVVLALFAVVVPQLVGAGLRRATQAVGLAGTDAEHSEWMTDWLLAQTHTYSAGTYTEWAGNAHFSYSLVDPQTKRRLANDAMRSDLVLNEGASRIPKHLANGAQLLQLGSQAYFYYLPNLSNPGSRLSAPVSAARLTSWNVAFVALFQPALALALLVLSLAFAFPVRSWPTLLTLLAWVFGMVQFGEVQPRYAYPIWFIGPIFMGGALAWARNRAAPTRWLGNGGLVAVSAAVTVAVVWLGVTLASQVAAKSDRVFLDLTAWQPRSDAQGADRRVRARGELPARAPAGTRVALSHTFAPSGPKLLRAWVRLDVALEDKRDSHDALEATVTVNGAEVARAPLSDKVQLLEVPVEPDAHGLAVEVAAVARRELADADVRRFIVEYVQLLEPRT